MMIPCTMQRRKVQIEQKKEPRIYKVVREYYIVAWDKDDAADMIDRIDDYTDYDHALAHQRLFTDTSEPQEVPSNFERIDADHLGEVITKMKEDKENEETTSGSCDSGI